NSEVIASPTIGGTSGGNSARMLRHFRRRSVAWRDVLYFHKSHLTMPSPFNRLHGFFLTLSLLFQWPATVRSVLFNLAPTRSGCVTSRHRLKTASATRRPTVSRPSPSPSALSRTRRWKRQGRRTTSTAPPSWSATTRV